MATDRELIDRYLAGERSAFDGIVRRCQDALFRNLLRPAGNPEQAEDLRQEALVKFYQALPGSIGVTRWRCSSARSPPTCGAMGAAAPRVMNADELVEEPAGDRTAEKALAQREAQAVLDAMASIRSDYREVLSLRYDQGLSYREIARATGASEGSVGTWLRRGVTAPAPTEHRRNMAEIESAFRASNAGASD